ncbi:MAG TPA: hypothetical protein DCR93_24270, partial [Cytophagales bacterium]|nr:hypothetical protein [Cytophagales bacterium]
MKIAFISTRNGYLDQGTLMFDKANGRLINQLLKKYPEMLVVSYSAAQPRAVYNEPIATQNLRMMPETRSYIQGFRNTREVSTLLKELNAEYDAFIFQLPFHAFLAMRRQTKPSVFHICANVVTAAQNPIKYSGWRGIISRAIAGRLDRAYRKQFKKKNNAVVTNGDELAQLYGEYTPVATVSSSILDAEVVPQINKTAPGTPFQLVFVGRPTLEKGVDLLVNAILMLQQRGLQVHLTCIGFTEEEFLQANQHLQVMSGSESIEVSFAGVIPFGPALLAKYQEADALVLPSRNEGTPRVLIEARSQGCPVVATRVGGIPSSIQHGEDGLLVPPEDATALAEALASLIDDPALWVRLARQGLERVRSMTVENFSKVFED